MASTRQNTPWLAITTGCCASSRRDSLDEDSGREALRANGEFLSTFPYFSYSFQKRNHVSLSSSLFSSPTVSSLQLQPSPFFPSYFLFLVSFTSLYPVFPSVLSFVVDLITRVLHTFPVPERVELHHYLGYSASLIYAYELPTACALQLQSLSLLHLSS